MSVHQEIREPSMSTRRRKATMAPQIYGCGRGSTGHWARIRPVATVLPAMSSASDGPRPGSRGDGQMSRAWTCSKNICYLTYSIVIVLDAPRGPRRASGGTEMTSGFGGIQ
nr:hypothetical protein CFP56_19497 [Quercus suber]